MAFTQEPSRNLGIKYLNYYWWHIDYNLNKFGRIKDTQYLCFSGYDRERQTENIGKL